MAEVNSLTICGETFDSFRDQEARESIKNLLNNPPVGTPGENGQDGVGIAKAEINFSGELVITLTNNTEINCGVVVGADGKDGKNGQNGADGKDGIDGEDGISVTKSEINANGELVITYSNNQVNNLGVVVGADGKDGADGKNGKSAYTYAQEGGYTGTEEEFANKLAAEIPSDTHITDLINTALGVIENGTY